MKLKDILSLLAIVALLTSCEKQELPVPAHESGDIQTGAVNMEPDYRWQIFYDLNTNKIVSKNLKTAWDLAFENTSDGFHVFLNSSKMMYAYNTGKTDINSITISDTIGKKAWDNPTGHPDSTAIGNWQKTNTVYIIDRGNSLTGMKLGLWKIKFISVDDEKYVIEFGALDDTQLIKYIVNKDTMYNLSFLSFEERKQVMIEPLKYKWDIVFTQYTHVFVNPAQPYLVTGCLLNRYSTSAVLDTTISFNDIAAKDINRLKFSPLINTIGYDWKAYTGSTYVTYTKLNYIIKSRDGYYYKLHFIDFLDMGLKGNPKWEYQKL